jgi:hypothetical protein
MEPRNSAEWSRPSVLTKRISHKSPINITFKPLVLVLIQSNYQYKNTVKSPLARQTTQNLAHLPTSTQENARDLPTIHQ